MKVLIRPRIQKDKWSLYWKTSMITKTELLDEFELDVEASATAAQVKAQVAALLGWPPVGGLLRLEGFEEPWELLAFKGVELGDATPLAAAGVEAGAALTAVRKVLVAEGACPCVCARRRGGRAARLQGGSFRAAGAERATRGCRRGRGPRCARGLRVSGV